MGKPMQRKGTMWSWSIEKGRRKRAKGMLEYIAVKPDTDSAWKALAVADWFRGEWARATEYEKKRARRAKAK